MAVLCGVAALTLHVRLLFLVVPLSFAVPVYGAMRAATMGVYATGEHLVVQNPWKTVKLRWCDLVAIGQDARGVFVATTACMVYPKVLARHVGWKSFDPASLDLGVEKLRAEAVRRGAQLRDSVHR